MKQVFNNSLLTNGGNLKGVLRRNNRVANKSSKMRWMIKFCLLSFISLLMLSANGQGYQIQVKIDNLADTQVILGYYFGDKQFARDTAQLDSKGVGVFEGDEKLPKGVYFVILPDNIFFELMVDEDQEFSVSTTYSKDAAVVNNNLKSNGNEEMELYIDYQQFMNKKGKLATNLRKRLQTAGPEQKQVIQDSLQLLHEQVKSTWAEIEHKYPNSIIAAILKINREIEVPEPPKDENGVIDSTFRYRYYKKHYFDNIDFSDERLLRTQFFHPKIDRYFEKLIIPAPDTIIKESKYVLDLASANEEVFKYTLQLLFNKYNNSNIMGMDKALVFFAENYYLNGQADWADSAWLTKLEERVNEIKPNLVGNKAKEMKLYKPDGSMVSLYMIDAEYTILFFFEPSCGHCKKATPKLKKLSDIYWEKGVEILSIYTQFEQEEWLKYIEEQELEHWINTWDPYNQSGFRANYDIKSTPMIYLLDKNKKIIGKRLDVETLEKMLEDEYKRKAIK